MDGLVEDIDNPHVQMKQITVTSDMTYDFAYIFSRDTHWQTMYVSKLGIPIAIHMQQKLLKGSNMCTTSRLSQSYNDAQSANI